MKIFTITLITIFFISCKNEKERETQKLLDNLKTYFEVNIIMDSTSKLDSFQLVKIDTITQRKLLLEQSSVLGRQLHKLVEIFELSSKEITNVEDQLRLYRMIGNQDLVTITKKDFDKRIARGQRMKTEIDTLMSIVETIDSKINKADTAKAIGYQAKCFYQLRFKDKSVKQDTIFIILNTNKDIVDRKDFLNLPYKIDIDKLIE